MPITGAHALAVALVVTAIVAPAPLPAQEWNLSAQAGRIRSVLDPAAAVSETFALGLRYDDASAGLRVSAGIPTTSSEALWGGVGAWKRLSVSRRRFVAGIDLSGNAFLTADRTRQSAGPIFNPLDPPVAPTAFSGRAIAGQALPLLGYDGARFQAHARAGMSRYAATFGAQRADRTVRLADVQLTLTPTSAFAIVPAIRRFEADGEAASTYIGVSAVAASTRGSVWGSAGQWSNGVGEGTPWSAGGRLWLHPIISLEASARHDTFDPLYLQPAQTSWSIGMSVLLGRRARSVAAPVPAAYVDGRATVQLSVAASRTAPSIAGDFTSWKPAPMQRQGDHWTYTVALAPGVYHYAFVSATGEWFVPEGVPGRKDDGMGGHVAVLVVR